MQVVVDRHSSVFDFHVLLSDSTMTRLHVDENDVIKITSPARKFIIAAVSSKGFSSSENSICISHKYRMLLECYMGETVAIEPFRCCQVAKKVVFAPISDTVNNISGNFLEIITGSHYDFRNIPVWKDMVIPVYCMQHCFEFKVIECEPITAVVITDPEVIQCSNHPVDRTKSPIFDRICYDDIGGIDNQLLEIRKLVENKHNEPGASAIIVAPSGCGKTFISKVLRNETKSHFEFIPLLDLLGLPYEKCKQLLGRVLEVTLQNSPAIVYLDDIDAIVAMKIYSDEQEDDGLVHLISGFIKKVKQMQNVVLFATAKSLNNFDAEFLPPSGFNSVIEINIPSNNERIQILKAITRRILINSPEAINDIATMTEGQTPSDLSLVCQKTVLSHLPYLFSIFDISNPNVPISELKEIQSGQGEYSEMNKKKNFQKKKKTIPSPLDPFSDLDKQADSDNLNFSADDDGTFSLHPSKRTSASHPHDDELFDFGGKENRSSQRMKLDDIFSTSQGLQSTDPFDFGPSSKSSLENSKNKKDDPFLTEDKNKKHHKHHRHHKDSDSGSIPNKLQSNPFNTYSDLSSTSKNNDPFSTISRPSKNEINDPFSTKNSTKNSNPFINSKDPFSVDDTPKINDPFASNLDDTPKIKDPFASSLNDTPKINDPFASNLNDTPKINDPFSSSISDPFGIKAKDPFSQDETSSKNIPADEDDDFRIKPRSIFTETNNNHNDTAQPVSPRHSRINRQSIDPFALPNKR